MLWISTGLHDSADPGVAMNTEVEVVTASSSALSKGSCSSRSPKFCSSPATFLDFEIHVFCDHFLAFWNEVSLKLFNFGGNEMLGFPGSMTNWPLHSTMFFRAYVPFVLSVALSFEQMGLGHSPLHMATSHWKYVLFEWGSLNME